MAANLHGTKLEVDGFLPALCFAQSFARTARVSNVVSVRLAFRNNHVHVVHRLRLFLSEVGSSIVP
jgi:hypothetical protein